MMSEDVEDSLTKEQREILQKLRMNLSDIIKPKHNDVYLLRFLRAKDFHLRKAEKEVRNRLRMEFVYNVENLPTIYQIPEFIKQYGFTELIGPDREGSPVRFVSFGHADLNGLILSLPVHEIGRFGIYLFENDFNFLGEQNRKTGRAAEGIIYIFDMEGFSLQQIAHKYVIEAGIDLMKIVQDYYPEFIKHTVIINAPVYFYVAYNILKPILKQSVIEKIQVFAKDGWKEKLLKFIEPHILPEFLGGTRVDPDGDPRCRSILTFGGPIPDRYYLKNLPALNINDPGVKSSVIAARTVFRYPSAVTIPNSSLSIEFRTEQHSIGFRMVYVNLESVDLEDVNRELDFDENDDDNRVEIASPYCRIPSQLAPVKTTLCCPHSGLYICVFDNTYSTFCSKHLIYRIQVIPP